MSDLELIVFNLYCYKLSRIATTAPAKYHVYFGGLKTVDNTANSSVSANCFTVRHMSDAIISDVKKSNDDVDNNDRKKPHTFLTGDIIA